MIIGAPKGVLCLHWYDIYLEGTANQVGPTPMEGRNDALVARFATDLRQTGTIRRLDLDTLAPGRLAGAGTVTCALTPISDGLRVEARIPVSAQGRSEAVVFELPDPAIWVSEATVTRQGSTLMASADIVPPDAGPFALDRSSLRITVIGGRGAVEIIGCRG